ncbi:hypothetical protein SAMN05216548_107213 [Faunimonas pinastri]|uniref:Uncharacterized protein n=1 Tax=Faunimonas pinastri TaxID=1855383 RepID=A0A1H9IUV8_9HYPH|nr:hypothetical protein [Faunimonas pinastri]SEQ78307.1 hypothetical protein SAMN05216548_107213 [Faunimonas pinastri]
MQKKSPTSVHAYLAAAISGKRREGFAATIEAAYAGVIFETNPQASAPWRTIWGAGKAAEDLIMLARAIFRLIEEYPEGTDLTVYVKGPGLPDRLATDFDNPPKTRRKPYSNVDEWRQLQSLRHRFVIATQDTPVLPRASKLAKAKLGEALQKGLGDFDAVITDDTRNWGFGPCDPEEEGTA